jgi:hypothetical protein
LLGSTILEGSQNNIQESRGFIRPFEVANFGSIPRRFGKVVSIKGLLLGEAFESLFTVNKGKVGCYGNVVRIGHYLI